MGKPRKTGAPCYRCNTNPRYNGNSYCKDCIKIKHTEWRKANPEKDRANARKSYNNCKERKREYTKKYQEENKEHLKETQRAWRQNVGKERNNDRWKNDMQYRIVKTFRNRMYRIFKKQKMLTTKYQNYLGCTVDEFRAYIESLFLPGMTWDNWTKDGWHLDHIIPMANFKILDEAELKIAWHYTNLQPMWAEDNYAKRTKTNEEYQEYVKNKKKKEST